MQKQVPQSLYFGDASLCSSFHFYSPLMDLRQTLFLFLEARQEKMERIHEDVSLRNQKIFNENNLHLDFLKMLKIILKCVQKHQRTLHVEN